MGFNEDIADDAQEFLDLLGKESVTYTDASGSDTPLEAIIDRQEYSLFSETMGRGKRRVWMVTCLSSAISSWDAGAKFTIDSVDFAIVRETSRDDGLVRFEVRETNYETLTSRDIYGDFQ